MKEKTILFDTPRESWVKLLSFRNDVGKQLIAKFHKTNGIIAELTTICGQDLKLKGWTEVKIISEDQALKECIM